MNKPDVSMPDFHTWADNLIIKHIRHSPVSESIEEALKEAFNQGYYLGLRSQEKSIIHLGKVE